MKQNFQRSTKPTREYNELHGERLAKDRNLSARREQGVKVKQLNRTEIDYQ